MDLPPRLEQWIARVPHPRQLLRRTIGRPVHVCNLVDSLDHGAVGNRVVTVCNGLNPDTFLASCLCLRRRGSLAERLEPRVQVWSVSSPPRVAPGTIAAVARELRRYRVDVLHAHDPTCLLVGIPAARLARVASVVYSHHGSPDDNAATLRRALPVVRPLVDAWVAASAPAAAELTAAGVPTREVSNLPTAVYSERFRPPHDPLAARLSLGIDPDQLVIGSVGRLDGNGNQVLLLELAARLQARGELDFRCLVVGEGPQEETLRLRARQGELSDRFLLTGFTKDVPAMLAAMDLYVAPAARSAAPTSMLEAMSCGLPVLATRGEPCAEVIRDGHNGLLFDDEDLEGLAALVAELAADGQRREELGQRARAHVMEHHCTSAVAPRYGQIYRRLVKRYGQVPARE